MTPASAKQKGQRLERFIAEQIRESGLDSNAQRQPLSGAGIHKADINTSIGWTIEAKNQEKLNWHESIDQAKRQAQQANSNPDKWALIVSDPRKPEFQEVYVMIDLWQFLELLKADKAPKSKEPDRIMKYKLDRLKQCLAEVIKELN